MKGRGERKEGRGREWDRKEKRKEGSISCMVKVGVQEPFPLCVQCYIENPNHHKDKQMAQIYRQA